MTIFQTSVYKNLKSTKRRNNELNEDERVVQYTGHYGPACANQRPGSRTFDAQLLERLERPCVVSVK